MMRKYSLAVTAFLLGSGWLMGQDTTKVQLIEFSDGLDNRRAWRILPPDTTTYRKINMYQTLKCDPNLINNPTGSGCGEWDAGANFILYDHINTDSTRFAMDGTFPDSLELSAVPTYSYQQHMQQFMVYNNTISETSYQPGAGGTSIVNVLNSSNTTFKAQYLWTASELNASGMTTGSIDKLELNLTGLGSDLNFLTIKMKNSALNTLNETDYETTGLHTVYTMNTGFTATGWHTFNLTAPFTWDGTSNIVLEISFTNPTPGTGHEVNGETTAFTMGVHSSIDDGYLDFSGNGDFVDLPDMNLDFSNGFSVVAWVYYDGFNSWSRIMDCYDDNLENGFQFANRGGNDDLRMVVKSGGDGINIQADDVLPLHQWTHVAFTMDGSGNGIIYVNGVQEVAGSMQDPGNVMLTKNWIAKSNNPSNGYFDGKMNDIQLWNTALTQVEIQQWMFKDVNASHPQYANLKAYYTFDDMSGTTAVDASSNTNNATLHGLPSWKYVRGEELARNMTATSERPDVKFIDGVYNTHLDSIVFLDSTQNAVREVIASTLYQDINEIGMSSNYIDTLYQWPAGYSYVYNANNNIIDSVWFDVDTVLYNWYEESSMRIARYITPYGNYLDLGEGFTWVYDMTDYAPLLRDTIDFQAGDHRELIDLRFEFIEGVPPRTVNSIEKVLESTSNKYEYIVNNPPTQTIDTDPNSEMFGLHYSVTGHSFNNPTNCAEFCARTHYFESNGVRIHDWLHFKECADNPLYPQGGTWIYDRTGWCPGEAVDWFDLDLTQEVTPGAPITLTYGVDPDPSGVQYGNWSRTMFFMSYGTPNYDLDAEVYDIIAPNDWEYYGRFNPICDNPIIELRNSGATPLTSAEIEYGVVGGTLQTYTWNGNLDFLKTERVVLPMHDLTLWQGSDQFFAQVVSANGAADDYSKNDRYTTNFEAPQTLDANFELELRTNTAGHETSWDIRDGYDNVLYSGVALISNTQYDEFISLPIGCYTLNVYDTGDDGLDFWANNDGVGFCRIKNSLGQVVKYFEPDFGDNIHFQFSVGASVGLNEHEEDISVIVYPNPSKGVYNIHFADQENQTVRMKLFDMYGAIILNKEVVTGSQKFIHEIDISDKSRGIYVLQLETAGGNRVFQLHKN